MQDYHKLKVWTRAHGLALRVYRYTARFPREERFTLVTQMRRSAGSVPTNIVEGSGRATPADFSRFLAIAAFFLWEEHKAHILGMLPYVLLLLCPLLHLFHGGHGGPGHNHGDGGHGGQK